MHIPGIEYNEFSVQCVSYLVFYPDFVAFFARKSLRFSCALKSML